MESKVWASSFTSCRLAPLTISESGMPVPSINKLRLVPFPPPIRGVVAHRFQCQRSFALRAVIALPFPGDPLQFIVFRQTRLPQLAEEARRAPLLKAPMHGTGAAKTFRQGFPLAARAQDIHDGGKHGAWLQGLASAPGTAVIFTALGPRRPLRNQRLDKRPKFIGHFPGVNFAHARNVPHRAGSVKII